MAFVASGMAAAMIHHSPVTEKHSVTHTYGHQRLDERVYDTKGIIQTEIGQRSWKPLVSLASYLY